MFTEDVRSNLQNIIQGTVIQEQSNTCTTIRNYLCTSYPTSTTVKKDFESKQLIKKEQAGFLKTLADSENLLIDEIPANWIYLTEGGESKVYLHPDQLSVIKVNDAGYSMLPGLNILTVLSFTIFFSPIQFMLFWGLSKNRMLCLLF